MPARKFASVFQFMSLAMLLFLPVALAGAETVTREQEQEFREAEKSIAGAVAARAERSAPEPLKQAQELLATAEVARTARDAVKFSRASRLSRAYAEVARTIAQLRAEEGKLAAARDDLEKARAELEAVKRNQ